MRWSDEEYEYRQEVRDKAVTARSARKMRTHCGKGGAVKFPSDYLTKKELKAMNGELKTFNINKPMTWADFKELPDDLKKGYIKMIEHRFNAPNTYIAKMFGCAQRTLSLYLTDVGLSHGFRSGRENWAKEEFEAWCRGEELVDISEVEAEIQPEVEVVSEIPAETPVAIGIAEPLMPAEPEIPKTVEPKHTVDIIVPENGVMTFTGDAEQVLASIARILGNANVSLSVNWTVIKEE